MTIRVSGKINKALMLFALMFTPIWVKASQPEPVCRVNIAYGPYVSLMFVNRFFSQYHDAIEATLACKVNFDLFQEYDGFIQAILSDQYDVTVLPKVYLSSFLKEGFLPYATAVHGVDTYALTSTDSLVKGISQLQRHKIAVLHPFAGSSMLFKQVLQQHVPLDSIEWVPISSYEGITLAVMERRVDVGVVIAPYFDLMAEDIRKRKLKTLLKLSSSAGYLMIHERKHSIAEQLGGLIVQSSPVLWRELNQEPFNVEPNSAVDAYVNRMKQSL